MKLKKGFTLVEILVAISIIGLLSSVGLATYINFNRNQLVTQSCQKIVEDLRLTQSLAANNQKPQDCDALSSWTFTFLPQNHYQITAECSSPVLFKEDSVPPSPVLILDGFTQVKFKVLRQGIVITGGYTLTITGFNKTKTITISEAGEISLNE